MSVRSNEIGIMFHANPMPDNSDRSSHDVAIAYFGAAGANHRGTLNEGFQFAGFHYCFSFKLSAASRYEAGRKCKAQQVEEAAATAAAVATAMRRLQVALSEVVVWVEPANTEF